jgi:hypothetical protein
MRHSRSRAPEIGRTMPIGMLLLQLFLLSHHVHSAMARLINQIRAVSQPLNSLFITLFTLFCFALASNL